MAEKTKVSRKQILPFVVKIAEATAQMKKEIDAMPDCSAKVSYLTSFININKKNEHYLSGSVTTEIVDGQVVSDEEKEMLRKFRAEKTGGAPVTEETDTVPADETVSDDTADTKVGKKRRH